MSVRSILFQTLLVIFFACCFSSQAVSISVFEASKKRHLETEQIIQKDNVDPTKPRNPAIPADVFEIDRLQEIIWKYKIYPDQAFPAGQGPAGVFGKEFHIEEVVINQQKFITPTGRKIKFSDNGQLSFVQGTAIVPKGLYRVYLNAGVAPRGDYKIYYDRSAKLVMEPASHTFTVKMGEQSQKQVFKVTNAGETYDLSINLRKEMISKPGVFRNDGDEIKEGTSLKPGESVVFNLFCDGTAPKGMHSGSVKVVGKTPTISGTAIKATTHAVTSTVSCTIYDPTPKIACDDSQGQNPNLATLDWKKPQQSVQISRGFKNVGAEDPLIISKIDLINKSAVPTSPFAFNGPPSTDDLAKDKIRSLPITFTNPPGGKNAVYKGAIRIESNATNAKVKDCDFTVKVYSPEPDMEVDGQTLDYGEIQEGFQHTKAFTIRNNGDADLVLSITDADPSDPDLARWVAREKATNLTIKPGAEKIFRQTYAAETPSGSGPSAKGHEIALSITSNDPVRPNAQVTLKAKTILTLAMDAVLVLDRSGSMQDPIGTAGKKIDVMKRAAKLFNNLLTLRSNPLADQNKDRLGIVSYNETNTAEADVEPLDAAHSGAIKQSIDRLVPLGATGIGGAVEAAGDMLQQATQKAATAFQPVPGSSSNVPGAAAPQAPVLQKPRKQFMVVLTDGKENRQPYLGASRRKLLANDPALKMYSIGFGGNAETSKLRNFTNVANGYYAISRALSGTSIFDLEAFYFKIFANAAGKEIAKDPAVSVNLNSLNSVTIGSVAISSSDKSATFLLLDVPELRPFYDLELISPDGQLMLPGTTFGGVTVQDLTEENHRLVHVTFPSRLLVSTYVGTWHLRLTPKGTPTLAAISAMNETWRFDQGDASFDPPGGVVPVGYAVAVDSDYRMEANALAATPYPGTRINLTAAFTDRAWPAPKARVKATVTAPSGKVHSPVTLYDDGTNGDKAAGDGVFSNLFQNTAEAGVYRIFFEGQGYNERGELTPREITSFVVLDWPVSTPSDPEEPCLSCQLIRWLIGLGIALLILILWYSSRRRG